MPRFSLVIPTLRRPDTFRHALSTLAHQTYADLEIVVQNNGHDPTIADIVARWGDPRIRHFSTASVLPMSDNWEVALGNAHGEFIMFVGDDDGLLPDACTIAAATLDHVKLDILSWQPDCYYWPRYFRNGYRNRLVAMVDYDPHVEIVSGADQLRRVYAFSADYSRLPMIYNSFVHRRVMEGFKKAAGRYFFGNAPDVTSGIINAAHVPLFARISRPLSVTGISQHSTGHNTFLSDRSGFSGSAYERELKRSGTHDELVESEHLQVFLANEMLSLRDVVFLDKPRPEMDFRRLIERMADSINERPDYYDATAAAILALAAKHHIAPEELRIPPRSCAEPELAYEARPVGINRVLFVLDGERFGIDNIARAAGVVSQLTPAFKAAGALKIERMDLMMVAPGDTLSFAAGGNGVGSLLEGWGEPEQWGTWSVAPRAVMRLSISGPSAGPLEAILAYHVFLGPGHERMDIACSVQGRTLGAWACDLANPSGSQSILIPADVLREGQLELEFQIEEPHAPAESGISSDTRLLGLGLRSLRLADAGG